MPELTHTRCFVPGIVQAQVPLVLLHGSYGRETDLLELAAELAPGSSRIGIRGTVALEKGFSFFQRFPDRGVDEADLTARVPELAKFIRASCSDLEITGRPVAVGFSNGAIMATALLFTDPGLLAGAILFRPLLPFTQDSQIQLTGTPVLVIDGELDTRRNAADGKEVADCLGSLGAQITHHVLPVGHAVSTEDRQLARRWLQKHFPLEGRPSTGNT